MSRRAKIISDKNRASGPMASAICSTNYDILDFNDLGKAKNYDYLIVLHNKPFPRLETNARVGLWFNDYRNPEAIFPKEKINRIDYIFLCSGELISEYREYLNRPVYYMPQCGFNHGDFMEPTGNITWDVLFIGHVQHKRYHLWRNKLLHVVEENFRFCLIDNEQTTSNQGLLYRDTKINLSLTLPWKLTTSNRLYNILAAGGFALVSYFPGIEKLFRNHYHLAWFESPREMVKLIKFYQQRDGLRERIKKNGLELYQQKHTAKHRIENMFDIMEGKETEFRGWL